MDENASLLASCPDFISLGGMLKATPSEEGGKRLLYIEASNEDVDHQNEMVLQKALGDSADYFKRHGNIDISHFSMLGPKQGIPNYMEYEIGKPLDVQVNGKKTFVKAVLYDGESAMAKNANMVWDSLTKQLPPARWYPSVGGQVLAKSVRVDPETNDKVAVIEKVRWNNLALDRNPVNKSVPEISTAPIGTFAKALGGFIVAKTLTAGYGTDSSSLTGGSALRQQSLDGAMYTNYRDRIAKALLSGHIGRSPGQKDLIDHCRKDFGLNAEQSAEVVSRFMRDLKVGLNSRSKS